MKAEIGDQGSWMGSSGNSEFEETLRLVARLSPPEGLEERVQLGLRTVSPKARMLRWPGALWLENGWMQNLTRAAAAAAIVAVVVGGGWGVSSHFQPSQPTSAIAVPPHGTGQGGFSSAGAMRAPQTLNGPVVAQPVTVAPGTVKSAVKTTARHGKAAAAKKAVVKPAAPVNN
jgi:hypothetical protein